MNLSRVDKKHINFLMLIIPFLMGIGVDLYSPSLPAIADYFHANSNLVQATIGFYMLGYAVGQMFLGVLSDCWGRRHILIYSGIFFVIVSMISIFSNSIHMLIICRLLQGVGVAGLGVVIRAVASDCYSSIELNKKVALVSTSWALGPILGPLLGGYIQQYLNWQADFYLFTIYSAITVIYIYFFFPETHYKRHPLNLNVISLHFKSICSSKTFWYTAIIASLAYSTLVIFNVMGPFIIQIGLGYSPLTYGNIALLLGLSYFLGNTVNRYALNRYQPNNIVLIAIICSTIVMLIASALMPLFQTSLNSVILVAVPIIFFAGMVYPNMLSTAIRAFAHIGGTINATIGSMTAGGVFIMTSISSSLKPTQQEPMNLLFLVMSLVSLLLMFAYIVSLREKSKRKMILPEAIDNDN